MCNIHYYRKCCFPECNRDVGHVNGQLVRCELARGKGLCEPKNVSTEPLGRVHGYWCHECWAAFPCDDSEWKQRIVAMSDAEKKALDDALANMNKRVAELRDEKNAAAQT